MIRPADHARCISNLGFLCRPSADGTRQLTTVCATIEEGTDVEVSIAFKVGPNPLAEMMVIENAVVPTFADDGLVWMKLPKGPCKTVGAWSHDVVTKHGIPCVFVPTMNDCIDRWHVDVHVRGCDTKPYGTPGENGWFDISQRSESLPFHDLHFPIETRSPYDRTRMGISGAVVVDETALRLVRCYDAGFQLLLNICGCFVRDSLKYEAAHIPLVIMERATTIAGPFVVRDAPGGVTCHLGDRVYSIDLNRRTRFGGLDWIEIIKIA
jgi:hypothetical protein